MTNRMKTGGSAAALWVGDRIGFDGQVHTVVGLSGTIVRLADADGQTWVIHLPHLLADPTFEPAGQRESGPVLPAGLLNGLPQQAVEAAKWWERQLVEVLTGLPPDAPPEARPRPEFDPATSTLEQREQAKAKELSALGRQGVGAWTIRRKRQRYQAQGLAGLVDWRTDRKRPIQGRIDPRVLEALRQADRRGHRAVDPDRGLLLLAGTAASHRPTWRRDGTDAVAGDVLSAVRPAEPRTAHHGVGADQTLAGQPARRPVRGARRLSTG